MTFKEVFAQVIDWLQQDKRITYRALKRQFDLDDEALITASATLDPFDPSPLHVAAD